MNELSSEFVKIDDLCLLKYLSRAYFAIEIKLAYLKNLLEHASFQIVIRSLLGDYSLVNVRARVIPSMLTLGDLDRRGWNR